MEARTRLTRLLREAGGREDGWEELLPVVYDELRKLARGQMARERAGHTLDATALVHEAWLRLAGDEGVEWTSRRHFYGAAARAMQRVLVDHARRVRAEKRGGDRARASVSLGDLEVPEGEEVERLLALDDALEALARDDARAAEVARLRIFAGLEPPRVAAALGVSERTVLREWAYARARLARMLGDGDGDGGGGERGRAPEEPA